jgi:hypothetical protein
MPELTSWSSLSNIHFSHRPPSRHPPTRSADSGPLPSRHRLRPWKVARRQPSRDSSRILEFPMAQSAPPLSLPALPRL